MPKNTPHREEEEPKHIGAAHKWRKDHGVPPMLKTPHSKRTFAADLFGVPVEELHSVRTSYKRWEIPEYTTRVALRYEKLCHTVWLLRWKLGYSVAQITESIGVRGTDVTTCLTHYSAYLDRVGVLCPACGLRTDPRRGVYCCEGCKDA